MAKYFFVIVVVAVFAFVSPAQAQDDIRILPPNPFYFLKEWQRGIKVVLSGPRKTEAILEVLDDKAIDLARIDSDRVLQSYKESVKQLASRLSDVAQNGALLDKLFDHALRNHDIFDAHLLIKVFDEERFAAIVAKQKSELKELIAAELVEILEGDAPGRLKEDLLTELLGRLSAEEELLGKVKNLKGDLLRRLKVLDQARDLVSDLDFKSKLNLVRQQILETAAANIGVSASQLAIEAATVSVSQLAAKVSMSNVALDRAEFHLEQANQLQANGNYISAFSQASAAAAVAKNALTRLSYTDEEQKKLLAELKMEYDRLAAKLKDHPEAKKLLEEAKKNLKRQSLVNVRIILATLRNLP